MIEEKSASMYSLGAVAFGLLFAAVLTSCDEWPGLGGDGGLAPGASQIEDTSGGIGSSCGSTVHCQSALTCQTAATGGLCTKNCNSDADCGYGSCQLVPSWGGMICLKSCTSDQLCRPGYSCQSTGNSSVCFTAPTTDGG